MASKDLGGPNVEQPILTQYCDGKNVTCPNWLSVFGKVYTNQLSYYG